MTRTHAFAAHIAAHAVRAKMEKAAAEAAAEAAAKRGVPAPAAPSPREERQRPSLLLRHASSLRRSLQAATHRSAEYLFDYNKVEMAFLFCSSAVLVAGIMFKSGNFKEDTEAHTRLAWFVNGLIVANTALLLFVLGSEMVRAPHRLPSA